jgi:curved DNA-binding protein CbpA
MDYYQLLGIDIKSTRDEIAHAYRKEIFKNHPDRNIGKEDEKLQICILLNEAYEILTDDEKRKKYDKNVIRIKIKNDKIIKNEQFLRYIRNRIREHSAKFENYYSDLHFKNKYEILISENIKPIIEKQLNIDFNNRFIDLDIQISNHHEWILFSPEKIYKRKYCLVLNLYDSKLFYTLLFDKKDYDSLFKSKKNHIEVLYFNGRNIKYSDKTLDNYIKFIVHYNIK